jgi:hypothetical protein
LCFQTDETENNIAKKMYAIYRSAKARIHHGCDFQFENGADRLADCMAKRYRPTPNATID